MAYSDFTIEQVGRVLGVTTAEADLFPGHEPVAPPQTLRDALDKLTQLALVSEKSRSEFILAPVLMAASDLSPVPLAIFSGIRLDVGGILAAIRAIVATTA